MTKRLKDTSWAHSPLPKVEAVEERLLICEECQERVNGIDDYVQSISAAALKIRHVESPPKLRVRTAGWGAATGGG